MWHHSGYPEYIVLIDMIIQSLCFVILVVNGLLLEQPMQSTVKNHNICKSKNVRGNVNNPSQTTDPGNYGWRTTVRTNDVTVFVKGLSFRFISVKFSMYFLKKNANSQEFLT